jgi:predicted ATPase/transcriptional regulator with XRE-family HTH domain/Flp pilus assembly protein TadD
MINPVPSLSFGNWIKQRRKILDLTQEHLAQLVGCSVVLIRKIESEERRPSRQIAGLLAKALQIPANEQEQFIGVARQERYVDNLPPLIPNIQIPRSEKQSVFPHALPAPATPFIGRDHELSKILQLILQSECRMLTLIGPGGIGKTRLALETAHTISAGYPEQFPDGIVYIPLTKLTSSSHLIPAIADQLQIQLAGARQQQLQLLSYLENKALLLVLDNLEQLLPSRLSSELDLPGIDFLSQVLTTAPAVKLLVTSRERLNLHGEWLFELSGLPVPETDLSIDRGLANALQYSSLALFSQHARRVAPNFNLTPDNLSDVIRICQLVEGFPLGIELAASWVRVLPAGDIVAEIKNSLDFLEATTRDIPSRHRSLRAVFDHSWALLTSEEKDLLARLSIFQGGFDRQAAEQVCGARLASLFALADKSLLYRSSAQRYELHELIRQYAWEKLAECPDIQQSTRANHSHYYLDFLRTHEIGLKSQAQKEIGDELVLEIDNLRAAWDWALETGNLVDLQSSLRCLHWFYEVRGQLAEGATVFHEAVKRLKTAGSQDPLHIQVTGHCLAIEGWFSFRLGRFAEARTLLNGCLDLLSDDPESLVLNDARAFLGALSYISGEYHQAIHLLEQAIQYGKKVADHWLTAQALGSLGRVAQLSGNYLQARSLFEESLNYWERIGDLRGRTYVLAFLGMVEVSQADFDHASAHLQQSLELSRNTGDAFGIGTALNHLGLLAYKRGEYQQSVSLFEQGIGLFEVLGEQASLGWVCNNLGHSYLALGQYELGKTCLLRAMQIAQQSQIAPLMLDTLVGWQIIQARDGEIDRAAGLLAGMARHPASTQSVRERVCLALGKLGFSAQAQEQLSAHAPEVLPEALIEEIYNSVIPSALSRAGL